MILHDVADMLVDKQENDKRSVALQSSIRKASGQRSVNLPAELVLEILTILAQKGGNHARRAVYVCKNFYPFLENYCHFKIYWGNMKRFQINLKEQRQKFTIMTIDLSVMHVDKGLHMRAYDPRHLLSDLARVNFQVETLVFKDLYTRMDVYPIALNKCFASSIKHLNCIESAKTTEAEAYWARLEERKPSCQEAGFIPLWHTIAGVDSYKRVHRYTHTVARETCFSSCIDLWWEGSASISYDESKYNTLFKFPVLQYLYVVVPRSLEGGTGDIFRDYFFVDRMQTMSNLRDYKGMKRKQKVKVAFLILWEDKVPSRFEVKLKERYEWLVKVSRTG
jgi:hypothetical protein